MAAAMGFLVQQQSIAGLSSWQISTRRNPTVKVSHSLGYVSDTGENNPLTSKHAIQRSSSGDLSFASGKPSVPFKHGTSRWSSSARAAGDSGPSLSDESKEVLRQMGEMQQNLKEELQKSFNQQQQLLGTLVETSARQQVGRMFGDNYQKPLLARSLQDVALLLPEEAVCGGRTSKDALMGPLERATRASKALVDAGIPKRLLESLQDGAAESDWLYAEGTVNQAALGRFISTSRDAALRSTLVRLRRVLLLERADDQVQELLFCNSAGIMCLVAAAFPEIYLAGLPKILPSDELEFDCRGRMDIAQNGDFSYIDIGEVKTGLDYAAAVPQLGLRLGALRWFVCQACGAKMEGVRLVGRLFVFKSESRVELIDAAQREEASEKWGYSLYLHNVSMA
eukprot:TRINITY_DN3702_c0_g1_i1.p1 TRINITY_DN3702_c0_g1~~TRINITY_DN3702_c0_g1_i1.p1  ORF type:complete len:396 (-),score=50.38 TRINITY_DN3702_c0_g1_i1:128-1315(-)